MKSLSLSAGIWTGTALPDTVPATSGSDITATAVMQTTEMQYNIVYRGFDGEVLYSYALPFGTEIVLPTAPEKRGYVFDGWIGYVPGMNGKRRYYLLFGLDACRRRARVSILRRGAHLYGRGIRSVCLFALRRRISRQLYRSARSCFRRLDRFGGKRGCETSGLRYRVCENVRSKRGRDHFRRRARLCGKG